MDVEEETAPKPPKESAVESEVTYILALVGTEPDLA
jgi:hypothetical protein